MPVYKKNDFQTISGPRSSTVIFRSSQQHKIQSRIVYDLCTAFIKTNDAYWP